MKRKLNCILLIEDNELTNIFNQKLIKNQDVTEHICVAESAEEALGFLGNSKLPANETKHPEPDIIFLDINMPGMNGWEFLAEYEKLNTKHVKVPKIVMLTTSPNPDDEQRARAINKIIAFKRKPLTKIILLEILTEYFPDYL
jgi:CheY-like chemotaxis protein